MIDEVTKSIISGLVNSCRRLDDFHYVTSGYDSIYIAYPTYSSILQIVIRRDDKAIIIGLWEFKHKARKKKQQEILSYIKDKL